jgi:hypothetical protein
MNNISGWIKGLITIIIFSSFAEQLLPSGEIKKYVRFAAGLITIVLIIKPVFQIEMSALPDFEAIGQGEYHAYDYKDIYVQKLEGRVKSALGLTNVKIIVNPENPGEILYVRASEKKEEIARYLGLPSNRVGD